MEKTALPIKTKIAAWWMVVVGLIFSVVSFWVNADWSTFHYLLVWGSFYSFLEKLFDYCAPSFIGLIFLFFPGVLLLSRKRWAWQFAMASLTLGGLLEIIDIIWAFSEHLIYYDLLRFLTGVLLLPLLLIPFLLIICDKENFSKIASSK